MSVPVVWFVPCYIEGPMSTLILHIVTDPWYWVCLLTITLIGVLGCMATLIHLVVA
jgi:hypothetical protein